MAKGNYIHCDGCGITYENKGTGCCPNCGASAAVSSKGIASLDDMRFDSDRLALKNYLVLLITVVVLAGISLWMASVAGGRAAEYRETYEQVRAVVDSGAYAEALDEYNTMKSKIESGNYHFTDEELQAYYEAEAAFSQLPANIYQSLAEAKGELSYLNAMTVMNVISAAVYVISVILLLLRFRLSFRILMGACILGIAIQVILELWGLLGMGTSLSVHRIMIYIMGCIPLIRECVGNDMLINGAFSSSSKAVPVSAANAPVGAAMPKVQELYSFEDMPELSGMRGLEDAQPLESQDADDEDDVMDEIAPIGVEQTRSEAPVFKPSEVAPEVQPVVPLTNYQVGGSITDEGENVAVTPLARPMFEVDMMDTESMPDIGGDVPEDSPAMTVSADMSSPTADKPVGIWFCSVCGNLNEHVKVCNGCGSPIK